jgi:hypothetical protein
MDNNMTNDDSFFRILDWVWGGLIGIGGFLWTHAMATIQQCKKETREDITELRKSREVDGATLTATIDKLMTKIDTHALRSEERHLELVKALASKQDIVR